MTGSDLGEGGSDEAGDSFSRSWIRIIDLAWYALVVAGAVIGVTTAISFAIGREWLGVKYLLFVVGIVVVGVAALLFRQHTAWTDSKATEERTPTRLERSIQRLPPLRGAALPPDQRVSRPAKVLVAGVVVLAVSFAMETWFGVAT